ncbi:MAG: tetratricopeptide repeat protein, partial [Planctomycetes bacterium]|nr:tetratricopeptide repeat protein [Planctomycetota bacterium]
TPFETLGPEKLHQQIESFLARYLVVSTANWGDGFSWQILDGDPGIRYEVAYDHRGVMILRVEPNPTGIVSPNTYEKWVADQLSSIERHLETDPNRHDIQMRQASLLREIGQTDEAIGILKELASASYISVRVYADLGWALFENEQYREAAKYLDLARTLPNSESIASVLADGANRARERSNESIEDSQKKSTDRSLRRIETLIASYKWSAAQKRLDQLLRENTNHPDANYLRGYVAHILGDHSTAARHYRLAETQKSTSAIEKLELMSLEDRFESTETPLSSAQSVRLAELLEQGGWLGRAIVVMEAADTQSEKSIEVVSKLGGLYRKLGDAEKSLMWYERASELDPNSPELQLRLLAARRAMRIPSLYTSGKPRQVNDR